MKLETRIKANLISWVRRALNYNESSKAETLRLCRTSPLFWVPNVNTTKTFGKHLLPMGRCFTRGRNITHTPPIAEDEIKREVI